jgi:glucokinase
METKTTIGIDIGGTKIRIGKVQNGSIIDDTVLATKAYRPQNEILADLIQGINKYIDKNVKGIGIGAPGLINEEKGIIYNPHNIPSWQKIHLKDKIESIFHIPVKISNDANCFALGENIVGAGKKYKNFVGLSIGTGVGAGIIINNLLYSGTLAMSGEFGNISYLSHNYEYYCSGQFFINCYQITGQEAYEKAMTADPKSIKIFDEFGTHLAKLIYTILLSLGPQAIILGGTITQSYRFFQKAMFEKINDFPFKKVLEQTDIIISEIPKISILGAASLVDNN